MPGDENDVGECNQWGRGALQGLPSGSDLGQMAYRQRRKDAKYDVNESLVAHYRKDIKLSAAMGQ